MVVRVLLPSPSPGYGRVVLALISFYYMPFDPVKAVLFYLLSGLLDAFDGWAARVFNQGKPTKLKCCLFRVS